MKQYSKVIRKGGSVLNHLGLSNSRMARTGYKIMSNWIIPDGPSWTEYNGYSLYLDPRTYPANKIYLLGDYEVDVSDTIAKRVQRGDTVIDAGGFCGHHMLNLRDSVGPEGEVYTIEPNPQSASFIRKTISKNGLNNVHLLEVALSDSEGVVELVENRANLGGSRVASSGGDSIYEVESMPLNSLFDKYDINQVDFIKVDIEGSEYEVFCTEPNPLKEIDTMIMEVHKEMLSQPQLRQLYQTLSEYGSITTPSCRKISDFCDFKRYTGSSTELTDDSSAEFIIWENLNIVEDL